MRIADIIFENGTIRTMNPVQPQVDTVAVVDGRIVCVGTKEDCLPYRGETTKVVDLAGRTMLPGFSDNHLHLLGYGISLLEVNLLGLTSIDQVVSTVKEWADKKEAGSWILGRGWDQNEYIEDRYFNRHDLDLATTEHPISVKRVCGHARVVNSKALEMAGINKDTPDPVSGVIERDPITGEPNGVLHEDAMDLVTNIIPPYNFEELKAALSLGMNKAIETGITSVTTDDVQDAGGLQPCIDLYKSVWQEGLPSVRTYLLIAGRYFEEAVAKGFVTGWGDEKVKIGPLKLFQDGSLGARTAALLEPYSDQPDSSGLLIHSQADFDELVSNAHQAGMQIGVHAIGDAAIDSTLRAFENALARKPQKNSRHRIIHYEVINQEILERTKELGVIADIQPKFLTTDGSWLEKRLGPDRARNSCAWKTIIDQGIPAVGGSDCPVEPLDPLLGIHAGVTRTVYSNPNSSWMPHEKLSVEESVALFTRDGAYGSFEEGIKGIISQDYLADFVVLEEDPWLVDPATIKDIQIAMTVIDGKICYTNL